MWDPGGEGWGPRSPRRERKISSFEYKLVVHFQPRQVFGTLCKEPNRGEPMLELYHTSLPCPCTLISCPDQRSQVNSFSWNSLRRRRRRGGGTWGLEGPEIEFFSWAHERKGEKPYGNFSCPSKVPFSPNCSASSAAA